MARSYAPISPKALLKKPIGGTPDYELVLIPGWLIFSAEDGYAKPQYAHFMIQNSESVPVVYRIRTKFCNVIDPAKIQARTTAMWAERLGKLFRTCADHFLCLEQDRNLAAVINADEHRCSLLLAVLFLTKDRSFPQFSHCHGYLPPKGSDEITILITAREHWPRDVSEFAAKRHKVLIEHLTVPPYTTPPKNAYAAAELARIIFKMTPSLTRMYCKLNIILPKLADDRGTSDRPTSLSGEILTGSK